jgi:MFS family permease
MSLLDHAILRQRKSLWQQRAFLLLWSASSTGYFASWIVKLALPLVAVRLTTSPLLVSGVTFAFTLPWLLFGLPAGALADHFDRRHVLLAATALRLGVFVALGGAALLGLVSLPALYAAALTLGVSETLTETATTAFTPMLVAPGQLEQANTRLLGVQQAIEVIALPVSGAITAIGLALAVGLSGAGYIVALVALLLLRGSFRPQRAAQRHMGGELIEGVRFLWRQTTLRAIGLMAAVINASWGAWAGVFVLFAVAPGPMRLSSFAYGLLLSASGLGGIVGTFLVGPVQRRLGRRWLIGLNILGNALMFAAPLLTANAWLMGLAILIGGVGGPMWGVAATSFQQRVVPEALRGRVFAAYRFISWGAEALGPVIGGIVAQYTGIQIVFLGSALLTMLMFVPFFRLVSEQAIAPEKS